MSATRRFLYSLYGLTIESNLELPALSPATNQVPDVRVTLGRTFPEFPKHDTPWFISSAHDEFGVPILTAWKGVDGTQYYFSYCDGTHFVVDATGSRVEGTWTGDHSLEDTCYYLYGQIAAFVLRLRGVASVHGSSVLIGERVLTISGDSGAGKSTTAAGFVKRGYPVLSEDVTALLEVDHRPFVHLGYPRINLWPDSADSVYGPSHDLPRIVPTWEKLFIDLDGNGKFSEQIAPLGAVYVLEARSSAANAPLIEQLSPGESLIALLTNTHGRYLVDSEMRQREFAIATKVVKQVPVRKVLPHVDIKRLDQMIDLMLEDFQEVVSTLAVS
jgi:hypothetical protein